MSFELLIYSTLLIGWISAIAAGVAFNLSLCDKKTLTKCVRAKYLFAHS